MDGMKIVGDLFGAGQDVPAAGGEERPRHEARGRLPEPFMEEEKEAGGRSSQGKIVHRHRQGRRPRHRQEHRGRGARLQQLRRDRPRRHGAGRQDPAHRHRREGRHHRALGPDHAVPRRDGARGRGDGAARHGAAAADRRRDHQQAAHRGEDRAQVPRERGARAPTRRGSSASWRSPARRPTRSGPSTKRERRATRRSCARSSPPSAELAAAADSPYQAQAKGQRARRSSGAPSRPGRPSLRRPPRDRRHRARRTSPSTSTGRSSSPPGS